MGASERKKRGGEGESWLDAQASTSILGTIRKVKRRRKDRGDAGPFLDFAEFCYSIVVMPLCPFFVFGQSLLCYEQYVAALSFSVHQSNEILQRHF